MITRTLLVLAITLLPACQERHLYTLGLCVRVGTAELPPTSPEPSPLERPSP